MEIIELSVSVTLDGSSSETLRCTAHEVVCLVLPLTFICIVPVSSILISEALHVGFFLTTMHTREDLSKGSLRFFEVLPICFGLPPAVIVGRYLARQYEVRMLTQRKVGLHFVVDLNDVLPTDGLRLVQDEEFVLAELASELLLKLNVEVGLHRIEEQNRVLTRHLKHMINYVFRLKVVELCWSEFERMRQGQDLEPA